MWLGGKSTQANKLCYNESSYRELTESDIQAIGEVSIAKKLFKPGQSGNPNGRPKEPGDIKTARQWNRIDLERLINKLLRFTKAQLEARLKEEDTEYLELMVIQIMRAGAGKGDQLRLNFIIEQVMGKLPTKVDMSHSFPKPTIIKYSDGTKTILGASVDSNDE